jgi:hypothetical protein
MRRPRTKTHKKRRGGVGVSFGKPQCPPCPPCAAPTASSLLAQGRGLFQGKLTEHLSKNPTLQTGLNFLTASTSSDPNVRKEAQTQLMRKAMNSDILNDIAGRGLVALGSATNTAANLHRANPELAKQILSTGIGQRALGFGSSVLGSITHGKRGGSRGRRKTRKNKRGGNVVRAFNTYNDPSTMHAKPVSGYNTAMPHNWVGGRSRRRR